VVVRGVYNEAEKKMLADRKERVARLVGWLGERSWVEIFYLVFYSVASRDLMVHMASAEDWRRPCRRSLVYR
jgi:hypothetical protein